MKRVLRPFLNAGVLAAVLWLLPAGLVDGRAMSPAKATLASLFVYAFDGAAVGIERDGCAGR